MLVSDALAVASASCMALSSMFLNELKGRVPLLQLARWQLLAGFLMTGAVSLATGGWRTVGASDLGLLAASSAAGVMIGSATYFATIYAVGPRVTSLLFALTAPFALALGYLALGETISARQGLGVALVLSGIVLAIGVVHAGPRPLPAAPLVRPLAAAPAPPRIASLRWGLVLGVVTAFAQALGSLLSRPAMEAGVDPISGMAVRCGLGALFFFALAPFPFARGARSALRVDTFGLIALSALAGPTLGMSLLMAALVDGGVGIVSTLSSMTPVVILPMVWIRSGTRPAASAWAGAVIAIAGTALIGGQ